MRCIAIIGHVDASTLAHLILAMEDRAVECVDQPPSPAIVFRAPKDAAPEGYDFRRHRDYPTLKQGLRNPRIRRR